MGLMNFDVIIKSLKMPSNRRHLCLYILLFSVVISYANAIDDQSDARSDGNNAAAADHFGQPNYIQLNTKNNNRDLSEFSVRKPQTPHHHQHHLRHQNSHNSEHRSKASNGYHHHHQQQHKQHVHQSNDSALNRIPGYQRQAHSPKKHSHYEDDNAAASIVGGGFHTRTHAQHHQHHSQQPQQRLTTLGPFRSRSNNRSGGSWSSSSSSSSSGEISNKRNWSDNLSRNRQAPVEQLAHSSKNRNRTPYHQYNPHIRTTKRTTTTTTTTTTVAPDDFEEKVFFDAQNSFNNIESDEDDDFDYNIDDDEDSDENYDTKKRSPSIGSFDRHHTSSQQSNENFQRDDPVRSSNGYNGITTTNTFKSQHSSNNDNYHLNMHNDGSMNANRATIETSKSFVERNPTTRNRNGNQPGDLTREKFERLGNAEAVQNTFRQEFPLHELRRLANAHTSRINREGACKWPKPKLLQVGNHTSKRYTPHCTVLHRCSDETGCCHENYKTCQPLRKENVTLVFWVHSKGQPTIEQLTFENHTECHCVTKIANTPLSYSDEPVTEVNTVISRCRCPSYFTNVHRSQCKCDCTSNKVNDICNKLKAGLEHFSILERRCITSEECERPTCAYGDYDTKSGLCPREDEALNFASNTLNED
ncbi:GATA zinc finger domain-containing protein 14-like [Sitodiplosis mosellana]|uniref:GATA zinc finger domain-containing protein 14-like n=1 Tax=Sitodiplosis mosellana TaxID=263140 RepID=UPI0024439DA0|nr:GATA zinc finger domain-containing protein 14-like [Sitodiplosis mosellana]